MHVPLGPKSASQPLLSFPCRGDGNILLYRARQCFWKSPCSHPTAISACLHLCPFHRHHSGGHCPDVQDTAVSQECRGVFCYQETSTFPSWKFEHHLIFMHSQHILQPISLFKTNSPSPPWDQPDRSSLLPELEKPGQPAFFLHAALSPSFPLLPHNRPDADG